MSNDLIIYKTPVEIENQMYMPLIWLIKGVDRNAPKIVIPGITAWNSHQLLRERWKHAEGINILTEAAKRTERKDVMQIAFSYLLRSLYEEENIRSLNTTGSVFRSFAGNIVTQLYPSRMVYIAFLPLEVFNFWSKVDIKEEDAIEIMKDVVFIFNPVIPNTYLTGIRKVLKSYGGKPIKQVFKIDNTDLRTLFKHPIHKLGIKLYSKEFQESIFQDTVAFVKKRAEDKAISEEEETTPEEYHKVSNLIFSTGTGSPEVYTWDVPRYNHSVDTDTAAPVPDGRGIYAQMDVGISSMLSPPGGPRGTMGPPGVIEHPEEEDTPITPEEAFTPRVVIEEHSEEEEAELMNTEFFRQLVNLTNPTRENSE